MAKHHFSMVKVDGELYNLHDDAYVNGEEGKDNYICKIIEMFEDLDGMRYFTAQWFYRAKDTVVRCPLVYVFWLWCDVHWFMSWSCELWC
ncbi:unnamed protein product [Cuscuta campestris]|uniref:BAH domain-containing protein n=1 Tax=Cuscuta campestris TaxID=132261 RepID=A0A484LSG1_9ASTE|nr:unnamed protein product [Cuscuta campestris]